MYDYTEPERRLPVIETADVLVVGGGPSGVAAALAAGRMGARTVLLESQGCVGGMSTSGLMSHWTGSADSRIYREIINESAKRNEAAYHNHPVKWINPEKLKTLYLEMLLKANVKLRLYTFAVQAMMEGNRICGVICESKSGRAAIQAGIVIDASGDGDIAADSGAAFIKGRETDGRMQPATLMFKVAGVDDSRAVYLNSFESTYETEKGELQALAKSKLPDPAGHVLLYPSTLPGIVTCNMTNCIETDGTQAGDLTRAELTCRSQMEAIVSFLRKYVPGYENCYVISSASMIGIRETRHFKGVKTLTEQDILGAVEHEDWVVKNASFNFDVHNMTGSGLDRTGMQKHFPQKNGYTIPYGCLVPESVDGLLFSGRNISGTHLAHSSFRAMPICVAIGEAAGTAAAVCIQTGRQPRELAASEIQKYL